MKVKKFKRILLYFGNPTGTCSTDRAIWFFFLLKSDVHIMAFCMLQKSFADVEIIFSSEKEVEIFCS
jgi:hypothetical protein